MGQAKEIRHKPTGSTEKGFLLTGRIDKDDREKEPFELHPKIEGEVLQPGESTPCRFLGVWE